jgi:hypothetical protein
MRDVLSAARQQLINGFTNRLFTIGDLRFAIYHE